MIFIRLELRIEENVFDKIIDILRRNEGNELKIDDIIMICFENSIVSSDYLFLILQELSSRKLIESRKGIVKIGKIPDDIISDLKNRFIGRIRRIKKVFITPLEVAKFYQCPRRLWLEKIVLSKQEKEKIGKVWDGEAVHFALKLMLDNMSVEKDENFLISKSVEQVLKKYEGLIQIEKKILEEFLRRFLELIKEENFIKIYSEKTIESIKDGVIGSIDVIGFKNDELVPIEIKYAEFKGRIKKEHLLQAIGESILLSNYFRKEVKYSYIVYFQTNSLVRVEINEKLKRKFFKLKRKIEIFYSTGKIPPKSKLPNYVERVCKGCHVKRACDNIELLRRMIRKI